MNFFFGVYVAFVGRNQPCFLAALVLKHSKHSSRWSNTWKPLDTFCAMHVGKGLTLSNLFRNTKMPLDTTRNPNKKRKTKRKKTRVKHLPYQIHPFLVQRDTGWNPPNSKERNRLGISNASVMQVGYQHIHILNSNRIVKVAGTQ